MALIKSQMIGHIRENLGMRRGLDATRELDWLNWALQDTAAIANWRAMKKLDDSNVKTEAGGLYYALPEDVKDILECRYKDYNNSRTLHYITPEEFRRKYPDPEIRGWTFPEEYTWEGYWLKLYPIPSVSNKHIELWCVKWPQAFETNMDEECPLPLLDIAIIELATAYAARALNNQEKRNIYLRDWLKSCLRIHHSDSNPSDWTPTFATNRAKILHQESGLIIPPESNVVGA